MYTIYKGVWSTRGGFVKGGLVTDTKSLQGVL